MKFPSVILLLIGLVVVQSSAQELEGWRLTFQDEFDQPALDTKRWNPNDPWGAEKNAEIQAYIPNAFEVRDGVLHIITRKQRADYDGKTRDYTSGMATTFGKFHQQYGRFEARCKVPKGNGLWPAFWMLPIPLDWPPEIDVMEILGKNTNEVHLTNHWARADGKYGSEDNSQSWTGPDFSADFHTFAVEWDAEKIVWFVDGVERHRSSKNIPHQPMFLLVNLALGGKWAGNPDKHTPFPSSFEIDYIRVYERIEANSQP